MDVGKLIDRHVKCIKCTLNVIRDSLSSNMFTITLQESQGLCW